MSETRLGRDLGRAVAIALVLALVAAAGMWWIFRDANSKKLTAYFGAAVGVYSGSDVRVLGVKVGSIDDVVPQGQQVKVTMTVDRSVRIPAGAQAVVVSPSVVSDRYVQLTPVYTGGAELASGAVIPRERTATPVELDQLYTSINQLTQSLGPNGANAKGALSDLLNTASANLDGNGQALNDTIKQLGDATRTLSGSKDDLFATVDNLQKFTSMLAANDGQVRDFNGQLADVANFLSGERSDLGAALNQLASALEQVQAFIRDNRDKLKTNVDKLASISQVLADQRGALAEVLDVAPTALGNLQNAYNASSGTLDARADINELNQPVIVLICKLIQQGTPTGLPTTVSDVCKSLAPILNGAVPLPTPAQTINAIQQGKLPQLPLPIAGTPYGTPQGGGH